MPQIVVQRKKLRKTKNGLSRTPTPTMNNKKLMSNNPSSNIKFPTSNAAITLIALIITVIVLLILAGVTLNMLMGENGIIKKAQIAKEKTNEAQKEEDYNIKSIEKDLDKYSIQSNNRSDNDKISFINNNNCGFKNTLGEVNFMSYGAEPKTYIKNEDKRSYCIMEKEEEKKLEGKFEISMQIYMQNFTTSMMGGIEILLYDSGNKNIVEIVIADNWVAENKIITYAKINDKNVNNTSNYILNKNGSGRYTIIGDGKKVYFYWGKMLLGGIDYVDGIEYNKIQMKFFVTSQYTDVAPNIYIEDLYIGEPLYYKDIIK